MSIIIRKTSTGYQFQDGEKIVDNLKITFDARKGYGFIKLPENRLNRQWVSENFFKDDRTEVDLENMPARSRSPKSENPVPRKSLLEYMTPEDKALYDAIMERAKIAREEATKKAPLTEEQKLRNKIARLQAQLEAALANEETQA